MSTSNATRLIQLRKNLGFSQRELAKEFLVSPGAIGFWESGGRVIPGPILKLMNAFEHHFSPSDRQTLEQQLGRVSTDWSDRILSSVPTQKSRKHMASLRVHLKPLLYRYLKAHLSLDPIKRSVQIATYSRLIGQIEKSKGLPLKIIQLASYLDPSIPPELRHWFSLLQGAISGMPNGAAARIIYEEFGRKPTDFFAEWSPRPIAAASLGQVHRARLHSGEWVAVKVQYPRIREDLELAFKDPIVQDLLFALIRTGSPDVLNEFKARVLEECDYRREAENQEKFREYFDQDPEILIPRVFSKYSSDRVLTTEFVEGRSFGDFVKNSTQEERNQAGERVVRFQGESYFRHGMIYADIHPGNLLFTDRQLAFVDFGRVISFDDAGGRLLGELMLAVLDNDPIRGRKAIETLGMVKDWSGYNFDEFWGLLREQHFHFWEDAPFEFTEAYVLRKNQLMRSFRQNHAIHLNAQLFWNFFSISTHDAVRTELRAKSNWRALILRIVDTAKSSSSISQR